MNSDDSKNLQYTARWFIANDLPVPRGDVRESVLSVLRPILGPEPGFVAPTPKPEGVPIDAGLKAGHADVDESPSSGAAVGADGKWLVSSRIFPVVGIRYSREDFRNYVRKIAKDTPPAWGAVGVTIHGTSTPSLSQRPDGFTRQHMSNLREYYLDQGWKHGPHLFVDDLGIWVFNPLTERGTHSPSFNNTRYGVEMLGDYDYADDPNSGRGKAVLGNAQFAAAVLLKELHLGKQWLNFHRHDKETTHKTCPGAKIEFAVFEAAMIRIYDSL